MRLLRRGVLLAAVGLAVPFGSATPAFAQRTLTVTPSTNLVELDSVTIAGTGFSTSVEIGFCQGIDDGTPSVSDCGTSTGGSASTTLEGTFSAQQTVRRFIHVPSLGRTVDCATDQCVIGAAEASDVAGTAVLMPISFATAPSPPATRGSITVSPADPFDGQEVTVDGTGFRPNAKIEILECVTDPADPTDCSPTFTTTVASAAGAFSGAYVVQQFLAPPGAPPVDCSPPGVCVIAAAEVVDIPGTIVTSPFEITAVQPDGRIRRRSDGVITGDGIYNLDGAGQTRIRAVAPGTKWTFAVQVENDGDVPDDITVTAPPGSPPFAVRYFVSYFDITSQVTGLGFTFTDVAPGQVWTFAVQFNVAPDAPLGGQHVSQVTFQSGTAPRADTVVVGVVARALTTQSGSD
jgi:hypothetical protein